MKMKVNGHYQSKDKAHCEHALKGLYNFIPLKIAFELFKT